MLLCYGETANGKYPIEAVQTMDGITRRMEKRLTIEMINRNDLSDQKLLK